MNKINSTQKKKYIYIYKVKTRTIFRMVKSHGRVLFKNIRESNWAMKTKQFLSAKIYDGPLMPHMILTSSDGWKTI